MNLRLFAWLSSPVILLGFACVAHAGFMGLSDWQLQQMLDNNNARNADAVQEPTAQTLLARVTAISPEQFSMLQKLMPALGQPDPNQMSLYHVSGPPTPQNYKNYSWGAVFFDIWRQPQRAELLAALNKVSSPQAAPVPQPALANKLMKITGTGKLYLIDKTGYKHYVSDAKILDACGLDIAQVDQTSDDLHFVADADALTTADACRSIRPTQANPTMQRKLIQYGPEPAVYFVAAEGVRRPIANPAVFSACGFEWGQIERLPASTVFGIPSGPAIATAVDCPPLPNRPDHLLVGRLIKPDSGPAVYLIDKDGQKRWIASPAVFNDCGLDWGRIETLAASRVSGITSGPDLVTGDICKAVRPKSL